MATEFLAKIYSLNFAAIEFLTIKDLDYELVITLDIRFLQDEIVRLVERWVQTARLEESNNYCNLYFLFKVSSVVLSAADEYC